MCFCDLSQLNTEWAQVEVINLINDGSGLGFGIIGGRSTGVVVKTILPGGVADRVSKPKANSLPLEAPKFFIEANYTQKNSTAKSNYSLCSFSFK